MAVHVVQGRDPWWAPLAVNVLGGLWNDWQQREKNKKEAAYLGELAKMYNGMQDGQNDTAPVSTQDTGQGLLNTNMTVPDGYNADGWANTFHKTDTPLTQFDLDTAGLAPTAPATATTTAPINAWANALGNSGNTLTQFDTNTAGIVPSTAQTPATATAQPVRAPIMTPMDFYRAALELAGTKRFRMLNPDRVQAMLTPYMKLNEEARQEQMRNALADEITNATDGAARINAATGGAIRNVINENLLNTIYNQNKQNPVTFDTGGEIIYGTTDGLSGAFRELGRLGRTLTPQEEAANKLSWAQFDEGQRQFNETMGYTYANLRQQERLQSRELFNSTYTDADGVTWIIYNNGRREPVSTARGLSEQQKETLKNNGTILTNIQTRREQLQKEKNAWILKGAAQDDPVIKSIDEQIKGFNAQEQRILQENNSIIGSGKIGQQKQTSQPVEFSTPPVGQPAPNNGNNVQATPPAGENSPNNGNTIVPMPPAVPPTAKDIPQDAILVNEEGQFYTREDIARIVNNDDNLDEISYIGTLRSLGYVSPFEFKKSGKKFRLTDNTPRWVMPDGTKITHKQEQDLIAQVERGEYPDIKNREEFYRDLRNRGATPIGTAPDMPIPQPELRDVTPDMANGINNTIANAGSRYVNVLGSNGNELLASDTSTEAGIQRALGELNGQFGEQRWADWASGLNLRGITNRLGIENILEALPPVGQALTPAPINPNTQVFAPPVGQQPIPNYPTIPYAPPVGQQPSPSIGMKRITLPPYNHGTTPNPEGMVLASNRRTRPQHTQSGYYSGDTRNGGQYSSIINRHAKAQNVDPDLIAAIIQQESGGNGRAVSNKGAGGLMQLMPQTARGLGVTDVFDPEQNIAGGTKYIAQMLKRYNGNIEKALWAYNAGPGNADKGNLPDETKKYIPSVMARYKRLKGIAATTLNTSKRAKRRRRTRSRKKR